jgi:hypothetical protein
MGYSTTLPPTVTEESQVLPLLCVWRRKADKSTKQLQVSWPRNYARQASAVCPVTGSRTLYRSVVSTAATHTAVTLQRTTGTTHMSFTAPYSHHTTGLAVRKKPPIRMSSLMSHVES